MNSLQQLFTSFIICWAISWSAYGQSWQVPSAAPQEDNSSTRIKTDYHVGAPIHPAGKIDPKTLRPDPWNIQLRYHGITHSSEVAKTELDSLKAIKNQHKQLSIDLKNSATEDQTGGALTPVVSLDFQGNNFNGLVPPDNSLAVSDNGYIVSATNSRLLFYNQSGSQLMDESFATFFGFLNLSGTYFDPKVLYDPVSNKFILVVLNGTTPANSKVVVAFSTSSNPTNTWWAYVLDGNVLNNNTWFDFPSIGVSEDELYVSGNLFSSSNIFDQTLIYQIEKANGFTGGTINWIYWSDVRDANNSRDFTVVPVGYGFDGFIGPGIYFVSSRSGF
ncbi:MAG: hypothetical protein AAFR59_19070, partial [Bacteroidota bacterium]